MTVTAYLATFTDPKGQKFHGSIFWDKYHPRSFTATICPHITESEVDYPVWKVNAVYGREGLESLIEKMKGRAKKLELQMVSEKETEFAPVTSSH